MIIFKLILAAVIASMLCLSAGVLTLIILGYIVNLFKLNYNQDAYWVFTVSFYIMIVSWILSFFFSITFMEKK